MAIANLDDEPEVVEKPDGRHEREDDDSSEEESGTDGEEEEEEDDEDDERAVKRKAKKKFDRIIADLKSGALNGSDDVPVKNLVEANATILTKKSIPKDQTLLHLLAETDKDELSVRHIKALVTALVQLPGNLLAVTDIDGKTPLFCAVSLRNHRLVKHMCEVHPNADSVLKIPKGQKNRGPNCLHQAIINKSSSKDDDLADFLIKKASKETLLAVDESGLTPLHLAVEYKRCDEAQLAIVEALVKKSDKALDVAVSHREKGLLSPYRYHEHTYAEELQKLEKAAADARKKQDKGDSESIERGTSAGQPEGSKSGKPLWERARLPDIPTVPQPQPLRKALTHVEAPAGKFGSRPSVPDPGSRRPAAVIIPGSDAGMSLKALPTPITKDSAKKKKTTKRTKATKSKATEATASDIKKFLKLYYLRKKKHEEALEFLYGPQADRQIYFDLTGSVSTLAENRITEGLSHMVFEDVLQYVAIPQLRVEPNPVPVIPGKRAPKPDGRGRTDLQILFKWLKEDRGVKTILKVIVDDSQEPAHSDEAIEACLTGMGVEIWDWKKTDVCSDVIHRVCADAREVHLYWSGNNSVLRGWGEPDGLQKLLKLEKVHLHVQQGLETRARTKQYTSAFKDRLESQRPGLKVSEKRARGEASEGVASAVDAVRDPYERHKWISTMEDFSDFLQAAERNATPPIAIRHPVTVAVIDDGVDMNDQTIQSRIAGGRSFCQRDKEENLNQPYYISGGGHGTAMAGLICKVCPGARLYILKLNEFFIEPGKRQITAESAARAVRAAVDRKVDIISMSWTIEKTESNKDAIADLERAIELAANRNILMFCAATDQGAYKDRTYPAATGTKRIFKIGAAEATGAALKWVGDASQVDFIFPGHQVVMERQGDPKVKQYTPLTGSSVATALASGLAALILYCVQAGALNRDRNKTVAELEDYRSLKSHERMKEAFTQIGGSKESEYKYLMVWNRFTKTVKRSENEPLKDTWMDLVTDLAEDLMRED